MGLAGGGDDFLAGGLGSAVGQIFGDGAIEQKCILADDAEQAAVAVEPDVFQRDAIEADVAAGGTVEPGDEIGDGGFTGAAGADEGYGGSGGYDQREIVDDFAIVGVAEINRLESDFAHDGRCVHGIGRVVEFIWFAEVIEDAVDGGEAFLQVPECLDDHVDGTHEHTSEPHHAGDLADASGAVEEHATAEEEDGDSGQRDEHAPEDVDDAGVADGVQVEAGEGVLAGGIA